MKRKSRVARPERSQLVARMMRAAERQVEEIELRLEGTKQSPGGGERDARTLAILARALQSLVALDASKAPKKSGRRPVTDDDDQDAIPDNIEALRRELSRKLEAMAEGGAGRIPGAADDKRA